MVNLVNRLMEIAFPEITIQQFNNITIQQDTNIAINQFNRLLEFLIRSMTRRAVKLISRTNCRTPGTCW